MKILTKALLPVFVLIFASLAYAQTDSKTLQMMNEATQKLKAVNSYRADTKMEASMDGQNMISSGTIAFKRPDKMHMVTTISMPPMPNMPPGMSGMKQEMYNNGVTLWSYMPTMKMAHKVDMTQVKKQVPQGSMGQTDDPTKLFDAFLKNKIKFVEQKTVDGKSVYVFEGDVSAAAAQTPGGHQSSQEGPSKMAVWLGTDTGLPYKVLMFGKDNKLMMTHTYSNYKLNIPINDSEFQFTPPPGTQIMDNTQMTINSMKKMQQPTK